MITAETENRLALVDLGRGKSATIVRRVALPDDPEFVAAGGGSVVVTSPGAGAVTILDRPSLRRVKVLRGFGSPHIAEISPDGRYAYVTDDARGQLDVIDLRVARVVARTDVGAEAHHMAIRPDGAQVWVALGESARTIVIVDTSDPTKPRVAGHFDPGFAVHDLRFAPDGRRVWMTAASEDRVSVLDARTRSVAFTVPGGAPPAARRLRRSPRLHRQRLWESAGGSRCGERPGAQGRRSPLRIVQPRRPERIRHDDIAVAGRPRGL